MRKPDTETMHIQLHGTDLAHLPFASKLKWLEFPTSWQWFLTWAPGKIPQHFKDSSIWPVSSSLSSSPAAATSMPHYGPTPPTETISSSSAMPSSASFAPSLAPSSLSPQPAAGPPRSSTPTFHRENPSLRTFLHLQDDTGMPDQPPTIVQTVSQRWSPAQTAEASLQRTLNVMPQENQRQLAQPAWKTPMERAQQSSQTLAPIFEAQSAQDDADSTSAAPSMWSPPEGYQSSTSTQRNADAARDAQEKQMTF